MKLAGARGMLRPFERREANIAALKTEYFTQQGALSFDETLELEPVDTDNGVSPSRLVNYTSGLLLTSHCVYLLLMSSLSHRVSDYIL